MLVSMNSPAPSSAARTAHAQRVDAGRRAPAVDVDLPARRPALFPAARHAARVDGDDDALRAEPLGAAADQLGILHRRGVERHLVGAGRQHATHVVDLAQAAADREGDEHLLGTARGQLDDDVAPLVRRGDVEKDQLVGAFAVVARRQLDRVAGVAQPDEVDALDDAPFGDVEAGDDALAQQGRQPALRPAPPWPQPA